MSAITRRRLACRVCTRRKVKCDKQIPCDNCVKRGTIADCERDEPEDVNAQGSILRDQADQTDSQDHATLNSLRARVAELEAALGRRDAESSAPRPSSLTTEPVVSAAIARSRSSSPSRDSEIEDAVTVLEFLAWGRMKDPEKTMLSPEALRVSERDDCVGTSPAEDLDYELYSKTNLSSWLQILLPSQRLVHQLVEYHNNCLLWFHDSYSASTFSKELASFYTAHSGEVKSKGVNLQWMALLFSVMAGTITSAPIKEAREWGFGNGEITLLSHKWYKAVIISLNAADFTANHSIYAVQAIAVLTNTAHMLGYSNAQSIMLASAVRIAQNLGLHKLDRDARGTNVDLETGRGIWQELCTQDWFSTSFSESYSINPLHSTSIPPQNCDDEMNILPESEPTVTSFCRFLGKIAAIMPALQDALALSNTLYTKHESVLVHDRKMRSLATARPPFLANIGLENDWPCYIPWARHAIAMSSAHKIIMIHRKLLGLSFTNPIFAFTRRTCLAASRTILKEYLASSRDESSPKLWTHQAFSVAACIIICFDMLHSSHVSGQAELQLVDRVIVQLRSCRQKSMIAARGVKVLNALQKQIADRVERRKRPNPSSSRHESSKRRRRGFDATEFALSFCDPQDGASTVDEVSPEIQTPRTEPALRPHQGGANPQANEAIEVDEQFALPADLNGMWNLPLNDVDSTQAFDNLLSFAGQGFEF